MISRHNISLFVSLCLSALVIYSTPVEADQNDQIGGIGYIQPKDGFLDLVSPIGDVIDSVYVRKGAVVETGELLVSLQARKAAELEVAEAELELKAAQEYGDKSTKVIRVTIADFEYAVVHARLRQKRLEEAGGAAFSEWQWEEAKKELFQARNRLSRVQEEYKKERANWDFNVERAKQRLNVVRERLNNTVIRAPGQGTILTVHREAGESGNGVIITMADLSRMVVAVDVFEGDLSKVSPGMKATAENNAFSTPLSGTVVSVDRLINAQAQTGKVYLRLNQAAPANRFLHMQVNVTIHTQP